MQTAREKSQLVNGTTLLENGKSNNSGLAARNVF
jgi:hypothetical protein